MTVSLPEFQRELTETIRYQAYLRYCARGRESNHAEDDWFGAEVAIISQLSGVLEEWQPASAPDLTENFYQASTEQARQASHQASVALARMLAKPRPFGTRHWTRKLAPLRLTIALPPLLWVTTLLTWPDNPAMHLPGQGTDPPLAAAMAANGMPQPAINTQPAMPAHHAHTDPLSAPRYTIQLLAVRDPRGIPAFIAANRLDRQQLELIRSHRSPHDWYLLLYGTFDGYQAAQQALRTLPPALSTNRPFIRARSTPSATVAWPDQPQDSLG